MDPYYLFLVFLGLYIAVLALMGLQSSRKRSSVTDFWLANRELGLGIIAVSAAASWITTSALLLATGLFLLIGVGSIWVWIFPNVSALVVISMLTGRIKNVPALTQPELMEIRYAPSIRAPVAVAITIMMVLFSVVDFIGFKLVLGTFFGVQPLYAVLIMAASVAFYVSAGGFRAVVRTDIPQYILLAGLAAFVTYMAVHLPSQAGSSMSAAAAALGSSWWDPFSMGGVLGALVFLLALMPGWIAEQDPWQKIWAAKDERSAKLGLIGGAALMILVYLCCFLTAIGLSSRYPIPSGEVEAEMLYLKFIVDSVPPVALGLLAVGFAAASMSCTDTFATSGASCISRDIIQRYLRPEASMKEMLTINRVLVIAMIALSASIALNVASIMDAVIIATVIGTTSYFFPLIGGIFWKRATKEGALAALVIGGGTQIALISYELFWLGQPLESICPYLTEHGVLVGLILSAIFFVGISLITPPPERIRLAPFFPSIAEELFGMDNLMVDRDNSRYREIVRAVSENVSGERAHLDLHVDLKPILAGGAKIPGSFGWDTFVETLKALHPTWYTPTGSHVVYRLSQADMLACVKMVRGDDLQVWLSAESRVSQEDRQRDEIYLAFEEAQDALLELGLTATVSGEA